MTGAIFAAAVDWDDWGVWGGRWDGGDIDIDCNNCFNNRDFNGKVNFNDVDWKNVDRSKINFDKNQLNNIDRSEMRNRIKADGRNDSATRLPRSGRNGPTAKRDGTRQVSDVRKSNIEKGLKANAGDAGRVNRDVNRPAGGTPGVNRADRPNAGQLDRPVGKKRPAAQGRQPAEQALRARQSEVGQARGGCVTTRRPKHGRG